jgi:hypothetical protein
MCGWCDTGITKIDKKLLDGYRREQNFVYRLSPKNPKYITLKSYAQVNVKIAVM